MPKIPVSEPTVGFRGAMQPTSSGDGYSAPGRAVQGLGNALGGLGDAFAAKVGAEDEFQDKLKVMQFQNQWEQDQIRQQHEFDRPEPNGYATEQYGKYTQSREQLIPTLRSPKMQQWAKLHLEQHGSNFYERDMRFEYGQREQKVFTDTNNAITNQFTGVHLNDPATVDAEVGKSLTGIDAMIKAAPIPEAKKAALHKEAASLAMNKLREVYTKADKLDQFYPAIQKMITERGIDPANPPRATTQSYQGWSITPSSGDHAVVQGASGAKFQVASKDASRFAGLLSDLEAAGVKVDGGQSGGYADRNIAGTNTKSRHSFGEAIDINWNENARGTHGSIRKVIEPDKIRAIAAKHGLKWGGDWKNPDDMHFEVDRSINYTPQPVSKRGVAAFAGSVPTSQHSAALSPTLTAYAPQSGGPTAKMEGGYAAARPGPDGKAVVRTLEDMQQGKSDYITIAGDSSQYGKSYTIPEITWIDSKGQQHTSKNVRAVVHDTGSAFKGAGDGKFDIPVARDLTNAQMNAQPFIKGGVKFMLGAGQAGETKPSRSGILTSLDDSPTADEITKSGASVVDFDLAKPGAKEAVAAAKKAGAKVAAYHEGAGGGASWGEGSRDLNKPAERAKFAADVKKLAAQGADYVHVDNLHDLKPDQLETVAKTVKEAGSVMIAKNNPAAWVEIIKKNPDLKPPYAVIEHGMKDPATIAAAKQLADMGVPVHFMEFGDPGTDKATKQKRKDPVSTHQEADAFVKANPWAQVTHMRTQDAYNGRGSAGGRTFRAEGTIPSGGDTAPNSGPVRVAQAGGQFQLPANIATGAQKEFIESALRNMDSFAKEHQGAQDRWAKGVEGRVKVIMDNAEKGIIRDEDVKAIDELVKTKPEVAARYGLDRAGEAVQAYSDEMRQTRLMTPTELQQTISVIDKSIKTAPADKASPEALAQAMKRKERMTGLLSTMRTAINDDPIMWADRIGLAPHEPLNPNDPESFKNRIATAKMVAERYGQPVKFFTKDERDKFGDQLKTGGKKMLGMLGAMHQEFGGDMLSAMSEISKTAPEAATIGWMVSSGHHDLKTIEDAAAGMERQHKRALGEKAVAPPKVEDARRVIGEAAGTAFSRMQASEAAVTETAHAIYEARAQRFGWTKPEPEKFKEIVLEVLGQSKDKQGTTFGGVQTVGGFYDRSLTGPSTSSNSIILPPNIKNETSFRSPLNKSGGSSFKQLMDALRPEDLIDTMGAGPTSGNNTPLSMDVVRRAIPVTVGNGLYMLATGDPSTDPKFIQSGTGKPYVLDLNALEPKLKARRPDLYKGYVDPEWGASR